MQSAMGCQLVDQAALLADSDEPAAVAEALDLYTEAVALHPANGRALFGMGLCHEQLGDIKAAKSAWKQCIVLDTSKRGNSSFQATVALAQAVQGGSEEQRLLFETALQRVEVNSGFATAGDLAVGIAQNAAEKSRREASDDVAVGLRLALEALDKLNAVFGHVLTEVSDVDVYIWQLSLINDIIDECLAAGDDDPSILQSPHLTKLIDEGKENVLPGLVALLGDDAPTYAALVLQGTLRALVLRHTMVTVGLAESAGGELESILTLMETARSINPADGEASCTAGDLLLAMVRFGVDNGRAEVQSWAARGELILQQLEAVTDTSSDNKDTAAYNGACFASLTSRHVECFRSLARCLKYKVRTVDDLISDVLDDDDFASLEEHGDGARLRVAIEHAR